MIKKIKSIPPKYLYSFKSQLEQFTIIAANSTLGATGLADMLLVMSRSFMAQWMEDNKDFKKNYGEVLELYKINTKNRYSIWF